MALIGSIVTNKLHQLLSATEGVPAAVSVIGDISGVQLPPFAGVSVIPENVAPELIERSTANNYPTIHLYCSKVSNLLREKFRTFSGDALMVVETRVSQDRVEGIESRSQAYVEAVTRVLDLNRGDWGDGTFYTGGYEVTFGPVKHGGRNFLQISKITFVVNISKD